MALKTLPILTLILIAAYEEGTTTIFISQKQRLEDREVKLLAHGHRASVRVII